MWAAFLATGGDGALSGPTAGHYWGLLSSGQAASTPVHLMRRDSLRTRTPGIHVHRVPDPQPWRHPVRRPPVLSVEHTVVDLFAMAGSSAEAVELVLRACRLRLTTPDRILAAAAMHPRRRRRLLEALCTEASEGVTSTLEREYRWRVARSHGLPAGTCQVPAEGAAGRRAYRDVEYVAHGLVVELDGRLGHEEESSVLRDQFRDNAATLTGRATLRFGWLAVAGQSCDAARQVATMLRMRGWPGAPRGCRPGCPVAARECVGGAA